MSRLSGGLLGSASGKVAGLVAFSWKGIQAVRGYVKPAYTNTDDQKANRTQFKDCSMFGIGILGNVLQVYMDLFIRGMSAFNWFIKTNKKVFTVLPTITDILATHGTLFQATITGVTNTTNTVHVAYSTALGSNGLSTDKIYAFVYVEGTKRSSFAAAEVNRSVGTIDVVCPVGTTGKYDAFLITARRDVDTTAITKVSDSSSLQGTIS
jgi:hypothetical protein